VFVVYGGESKGVKPSALTQSLFVTLDADGSATYTKAVKPTSSCIRDLEVASRPHLHHRHSSPHYRGFFHALSTVTLFLQLSQYFATAAHAVKLTAKSKSDAQWTFQKLKTTVALMCFLELRRKSDKKLNCYGRIIG
jgi:hypothetical protein